MPSAASLDDLVAVDVSSLGDEAAREHVLALHRARARVDAATVAASGEVDRRGLHRADGGRSAVAWVAARVGASRAQVAADVRLARDLHSMPVVAAAFAAGRVTQSQATALAAVRTPAVAGVFTEMEGLLVDQVAGLTGADTSVLLRAWREQARVAVGDVDPDEPDPAGAPRVAVDCTRTFDGRWALSGEMDAEHGALIGGTIAAQVDAMWDAGTFTVDDGLSPAERRGLALADVLARKAQPRMRHDRPRPSVEVIVDEHTLQGVTVTDPTIDGGADLASRICAYDDGSPLPLTTLARLLCGADVHRIVLSADGEPLDVGRTHRLATAAQRLALRQRHGGCAWTGCHAPFDWCEAHHIHTWDNGGPTDLANLVPLCPHHHHRLHAEGFTLTLEPDGTTHLLRPPDPTTGQRHQVTPARRRPRTRPPTPAPCSAAPHQRALLRA